MRDSNLVLFNGFAEGGKFESRQDNQSYENGESLAVAAHIARRRESGKHLRIPWYVAIVNMHVKPY